MRENELAAQEKRQRELEMLAVRREADDLFAHNENEKQGRRLEENKELQDFHQGQMVSVLEMCCNSKKYYISSHRKTSWSMPCISLTSQNFPYKTLPMYYIIFFQIRHFKNKFPDYR